MRHPDELKQDRSLAINGGTPRFDELPWEDTGIVAEAADDVAALIRTRRTVYWGGGPHSKRLEADFAALIGRDRAFFHQSGTAALQTALFALGVDEGTPVALSDSGFVASLNAIYHLRARPVFLPTHPDTLQCVDDVAEWTDGTPVHTALITHFFGNVADVEAIRSSSGAQYLVEDGGQAHGATLRGKPVGSYGEIGSFAGSTKKLVTAGQGGLNVYDGPDIDWRMRTYGHHGKSGNFEGVFPGYNFRGGEIEAILAHAALRQLPERVAARNATADAMFEIFDDAGIRTARPAVGLDCTPAWFDVALVLDEEWAGHRDWLVDALVAEGIPGWHYPALIGMPWVKPWMTSRGWWGEREEHILGTERALWDRTLVLGTQMSPQDARRIAAATAELLKG
ncbi:DegT/DnrJ/EryC1/StrS family aminotransferase [Streptomyces sp. NPDC057565]|uniref:DegT/DnrJ/EryC1/StrS family aminotransferase n=1 Tax=Streptomyces sp. NPDC057565 TaxID=3346169 RepID=UPI003695B1DB